MNKIKDTIKVIKKEIKSLDDNLELNCSKKGHDHTDCVFCKEEKELMNALSHALVILKGSNSVMRSSNNRLTKG